MLVARVLEEIEDAFLLQQAAQKTEIAFAVLNAVVPLVIRDSQRVANVRETEAAAHFLEDLRHGLLLEHATIRAAREKPEPGAH